MSTPAIPSATAAPKAPGPAAVTLPQRGVAKVKSVLSGDTVVLLGRPKQPNQPPPEAIFTMDRLSCPRIASKSNPCDEPGAFTAREWLRKLVVGKSISFETRKQAGAGAADRVYGWLFFDQPPATNGSANGNEGDAPKQLNLNVEVVREGLATPRAVKFGATGPEDPDEAAAAVEDPAILEEREYENKLLAAYKEAKEAGRGIHSESPMPLVRKMKNAVDDFSTLALVEACQKHANQKRLTCVIEHVFDGSRFRCHVTDPAIPDFQYASFTLLLAGVTSPRMGNPRAEPPTANEPFAEQARNFVLTRLLQRELPISLIGTDKSGGAAVGTVHHPRGNIALELLKVGLARMTDWSVRLMAPGEVPPLRVAENNAKRTLQGIWHAYAPPVLTNASEVRGTVIEVVSGDTILVLPDGKTYDNEDILLKVSLASIRAPRVGNERAGRPDEPYSYECKEKLRVMLIGKTVSINMHYERDIPIRPEVNERRSFGTISTPKHEDISEVLIKEGLAVTQRHRDDEEKSPRYDILVATEAEAKAAKKGVHKEGEYKRGLINDVTDPRKAKTYAGSLIRAGNLKATVDYVFNGALFKLHVPSENCYIRFAPGSVRCPQPSPSVGSKQPGKSAEPFGDEAKRHSRLNLLQRQVEISCSSVTNGGVVNGSMYIGFGNQRRDYTIELLGAGLATVDQRKIDYGEAPKYLIDAQTAARANKVGLWSLETPEVEVKTDKPMEKSKGAMIRIRLSEIRSGTHFFYQVIGDDAAKVIDDSMKLFTQNNGTAGAPCDAKVGKVVAALFNDGTGKSWYRAKIVERKGPGRVAVLFVDHGNTAVVPVSSHLRPLDNALDTTRIPAVAKEGVLAFCVTRSIETDEGHDAARMLQSVCWGKDLTATLLAPNSDGKKSLVITAGDASSTDDTMNAQLVFEGLARVAKQAEVDAVVNRMVDGTYAKTLASDMRAAEEAAKKSRTGMWRYGDIGDDDEDM